MRTDKARLKWKIYSCTAAVKKKKKAKATVVKKSPLRFGSHCIFIKFDLIHKPETWEDELFNQAIS